MWLEPLVTQFTAVHGQQSAISRSSSNHISKNDRVTAGRLVSKHQTTGSSECFVWINYAHPYLFIASGLIQQHLVLNRMNKQDSTPLSTIHLTDRHTQIITLKSITQHRAALPGTYWHHTTTTLSKAKQRKRQWMWCRPMSWVFMSVFGCSRSGCSSILPPRHNSCPLIYIPNLATIKIPRLLIVSVSHTISAPTHPNAGERELALSCGSTVTWRANREPEAH